MSDELEYRFRANLQPECGPTFIDLKAGGGQFPPVIAYDNDTNTTNPNQVWDFYSVGGSETRVVVKNTGNDYTLFTNGDQAAVRCEDDVDVRAPAAQWYFEGGDINDIREGTIIRLRNVEQSNSYLDLAESNTDNGTALIVYPGHGGPNQSFRVFMR